MNQVLDAKNMKRIVLLEDVGLYLKKGMKGYLRDVDTAYLDYDNRLAGSGFILNTFVDGNEYVPYCTGDLRYEIVEEELYNMWAVVLSGMLRKVDIVNLNSYEEWQLKSFNTLEDGQVTEFGILIEKMQLIL